MLETLTGKSYVCRNTYINIFGLRVFLNETSATFINKTDDCMFRYVSGGAARGVGSARGGH